MFLLRRFTQFSIEPHTSCSYDYVAVYDGPTASSPLIGRYCGNVAPDIIRSTGNSMLVRFVSDISIAHAGFVASYQASYGEFLNALKIRAIVLVSDFIRVIRF